MPTQTQKQEVHAWWTVLYKDGTKLEEYPADGSYTPYRKIKWDNVATLVLESESARTELPMTAPKAGYKWSLRSRHMKLISHGVAAMAYILVESKIDEEVKDSTISTLYWLPNGAVHSCTHFNCHRIRQYTQNISKGEEDTLERKHVES